MVLNENFEDTEGDNLNVFVQEVSIRRAALHQCTPGDPNRALACINLSASLWTQYESTREDAILIEAIEIAREAINSCPSPPELPLRFLCCYYLSLSLHSYHEQTGNQQPLIEAIDLKREALSLIPQGHPNRAMCCRHLALSLWTQYEYTGDEQLLIESIGLEREAMSLCSSGHPDRLLCCQNLASSLLMLYDHTGDERVLAEIIEIQREGLSLCAPGHAWRPLSCRNLAIPLHTRYEATGDENLLIEAIDLKREALSLCPPGHVDRALSCRTLAASLHVQFSRTGDLQLLTETITLGREALSLCQLNHPDHPRCCRLLGECLHTQYEHTGDGQVLYEAIGLKRQALAMSPPGHYFHAMSGRNLATSLQSLHNMHVSTNDEHILQEIVELYREGLRTMPERMAWRHRTGLSAVYLQANTSFYDIGQSIEYLRQSVEHDFDKISYAIEAIMSCLDKVWDSDPIESRYHSALVPIYTRLAARLPLLSNPVLKTQAQLYALRRCTDVGSDGFVSAALAGNPSSGLEILECTQGLLWSQLIHYRDPQLNGLPADLAEDLEACLKAVRNPTSHRSSDLRLRDCNLTERDMQHNQSARIQTLVREIRLLPGLDRFMLGETFQSLCRVAVKYPVVVLVNARKHSYALITIPFPNDAPENHNASSLIPLNITREEVSEILTFQEFSRTHRGGEASDGTNLDAHRGERVFRVIETLPAPWDRQMRTLWTKIVQPIFAHLELQPSSGHARPRLYWCLTGIFARLPLHAAGIYDGPQRIFCSDYVVSTYTPTLASLLRTQKTAIPMSRDSISLTLVAEKDAKDSRLAVIPQVDAELAQIALIARSCDVPIAHQIAGSTTVKDVSAAMKAAKIVHLACHGVQDASDATQSGFCLGDGRLTIAELMEAKMDDPFLAFLSACETAKGDIAQPDQVMHLAAAMLFCGFKSVVATMWAINDFDGPKVAKWFYEALFANDIIDIDVVAYALDAAVGKLRDSGVPPNRWAPFIHMGA